MRKELFQAVCNRLRLLQQTSTGEYVMAQTMDENKAVFKHFDLWNHQTEYLDEEQPFYAPAVFVEFLPIRWRHQGQGVRDATISFKLHIVTRRNMPTRAGSVYADEALGFLELLDAVNHCLHGFKGPQFGAMTASLSETDNNFDEHMHSVEQYDTLVTDITAQWPHTTQSAQLVIEEQ
jgi:hypothetical protein